jgi:hypothetical protein
LPGESGPEADVQDGTDSLPDVAQDAIEAQVEAQADEASADEASTIAPDSDLDVDAACSGASGNLLVIAGNDWVYNGPPLSVAGGSWIVTVHADPATGMPNTLSFDILDSTQGDWIANFSTSQLGTPIQVGSYPNAERAAFATSGHPGLEIAGQARGCDGIVGQFTVLDIEATPGSEAGTQPTLHGFTATFQQSCEYGSPMDVGCIHFSQ